MVPLSLNNPIYAFIEKLICLVAVPLAEPIEVCHVLLKGLGLSELFDKQHFLHIVIGFLFHTN